MIKIFQKGFSMTLAFFGIIAIILFIVAFKNLKCGKTENNPDKRQR